MGRNGFALEIDFLHNTTFKTWRKSLRLPNAKRLTYYGLSCPKRRPPATNHLAFTFLVVTYLLLLDLNKERTLTMIPLCPRL